MVQHEQDEQNEAYPQLIAAKNQEIPLNEEKKEANQTLAKDMSATTMDDQADDK